MFFGDSGKETVGGVRLGEGSGFFVTFEGAAGVPDLGFCRRTTVVVVGEKGILVGI